MACLNRIKQSRLFADRAETTLTRSRIYYLASTLDKKERLFLPRIATATTILQTLTPLRPIKAAEVAAAAKKEAQIGAKGEPMGAPELAITTAK
jgi:hypothetical protein